MYVTSHCWLSDISDISSHWNESQTEHKSPVYWIYDMANLAGAKKRAQCPEFCYKNKGLENETYEIKYFVASPFEEEIM